MRCLLSVLLVASPPLFAAFELLESPVPGVDSFPQIERANPVTGEISIPTATTRLAFQEVGGNFVTVYDPTNPRPGTNFEATTLTTSLGDAAALGGGETFITMWDRVDNFTAPVEGIVTIFRNGSLEEFAPRATAALGGGNSGFHYRYPVADATGSTLAMVGLDGIFRHFIVRATEGNVEIIAQESVTDYPGSTQKFTEFGPEVFISPDGSQIAFYGRSEGTEDLQGLFLYDGSQIVKIVESGVTPPGTAEPLDPIFPNQFFEADPFFGANGELFVFIGDTDALLKYESGTLEVVVQPGDEVDGKTITATFVGDTFLAPTGELLINDFGNDNNRYLIYDGSTVSTFLEPRNFIPGEDAGQLVSGDDAFYAVSTLSPESGDRVNTLYRLPFNGADPVAVHTFDATTFVSTTAIGGGNFIFNVSEVGLIIGTEDDFTLDNGGGGFDSAEEAYNAYVASLPGDQQDTTDDPDGDGRNNIREFAEGTNPAVADQANPDHAMWELKTETELGLGSGTDRYAFLTLSLNPDADGIAIWVDAATTPDGLDPFENDFINVSGPVTEGGSVVYTFRSPFTLEVNDQIFAIFDYGFLPTEPPTPF